MTRFVHQKGKIELQRNHSNMAYTQQPGTFLVRRSVSSGLIERKNTSHKNIQNCRSTGRIKHKGLYA
jgi:hypothetical protein